MTGFAAEFQPAEGASVPPSRETDESRKADLIAEREIPSTTIAERCSWVPERTFRRLHSRSRLCRMPTPGVLILRLLLLTLLRFSLLRLRLQFLLNQRLLRGLSRLRFALPVKFVLFPRLLTIHALHLLDLQPDAAALPAGPAAEAVVPVTTCLLAWKIIRLAGRATFDLAWRRDGAKQQRR